MKLYACYTESHKEMADDIFKPSIKDDFELMMRKIDQRKNAYPKYGNEDHVSAMVQRVGCTIAAIEDNMGDVFISSDVDIVFFKPVKDVVLETLNDNDIVLQNTQGEPCPGFFICRANEKTLHLWEAVQDGIKSHKRSKKKWIDGEQKWFNRLKERHQVKWGMFDRSFSHGSIWNPLKNKRPHVNEIEQMYLWHAAYISGVTKKTKAMKLVLNEFKATTNNTR